MIQLIRAEEIKVNCETPLSIAIRGFIRKLKRERQTLRDASNFPRNTLRAYTRESVLSPELRNLPSKPKNIKKK